MTTEAKPIERKEPPYTPRLRTRGWGDRKPWCEQCGQDAERIVVVGRPDDPDGDNRNSAICRGCLVEALAVLDGVDAPVRNWLDGRVQGRAASRHGDDAHAAMTAASEIVAEGGRAIVVGEHGGPYLVVRVER